MSFVDSIVFFLAVALTSSALIIERMEGLLDRSWVAGVSPGEILFSHVVTQFVVMCGQTALVLIFMILVFGVECKGDIGWVIILTILQGLCGMCFGKTRRLFIRVSVKIIQQIDDDLQFLRKMRFLSQKCKSSYSLNKRIPIIRRQKKMYCNLNFSSRRVCDFGDLRTRKKCHPTGSGQLLSYTSSQRYVWKKNRENHLPER